MFPTSNFFENFQNPPTFLSDLRNPSFTFSFFSSSLFWFCRGEQGAKMADWGPVVIAVMLFVLLTPGLLFQIPGHGRLVEFGNMETSGASILVHSVIYFGLITIFLIAIGVHIYTDAD
ncbi:uncharacterized protein LOC126599403 [Malus sylvestris]|uniref:uncharacterized protein n=1 Tax=Malus domestica TaxID=3750 RepID=UPI0007EC2DC1|nr:uncharacterized protein LOC103424445 [Malus domestica]XP_050121739.1 uncharacterized protein LOC126599403 [Malus sylvestris]